MPPAGDRRQADGVYYTPDWVVDQIVQLALPPVLGSTPPTIVDPACGRGAFLLGALRFLLRRARTAPSPADGTGPPGAGPPDAGSGDAPPSFAQARELLRGIHGVDIDRQAVAAARTALAELVVHHTLPELSPAQRAARVEQLAVELTANLKHGDALVGRGYGVAAKSSLPAAGGHEVRRPFDWQTEFPGPCRQGGFDAVIGNPPYLNARRLHQAYPAATKRYFREQYVCARGGYDLYVLFLERALQLLRPGGRWGWIVPNKILSASYAAPCRSLLAEQSQLEHVLDLSSHKVFAHANVYPYVLIGSKVDRVTRPARPVWPAGLQRPSHRSPVMTSVSDLDVESRVATHPLGERARLHSGATGFTARRLADALVEHAAHDRPAFQFIVSGNIDRYQIRLGDVRFMHRRFVRPTLPCDAALLSPAKARLYGGPKIVVAGLSRRLEAAFDAAGLALGVQVYAIADPRDDPRYLLGVLNSSLMTWLFRRRFAAKRLAAGYLAVNKGQLVQLPIRVFAADAPDFALRDQIARLVEARSTAGGRLDAATRTRIEQRLDQAVFRLYGVSQREAARIEQELAADLGSAGRGGESFRDIAIR